MKPEDVTDEMVVAAARCMKKLMADECSIDEGDQWKIYGDNFMEDSRKILAAAINAMAQTDAQAQIDALKAERDALRKDAERYRWLRDVGDATWRPFDIREGYSAEQADAAIDAVLAKEPT